MAMLQKPEKRATVKARRKRAERRVVRTVREDVAERDGRCRLAGRAGFGLCGGPSEWAHLEGRWKTRGKPPEERHMTSNTAMLCRVHHDQLDGRRLPRLNVEAQSALGADGCLKWTLGDQRYQEA